MITKEELLQLLQHPDPDRRHSALHLLSSTGEDWVYEHIITMLGDPDWRIRKAAIEILVHNHTPEIVQEIIPGLRDDDNAGRRNAALDALIQIGPPAIEHLRILIEDKDADVRKFVVDILGEIGSRQSVPVLISFLNDPDENVRSAAVEFLGKIRDFRAIGPFLDHIEENNFWLTYTLVIALGEMRNPRTIPSLITLLDDESLVISVLMAFGSIPTTATVSAIIPFLSHSKDNIRKIALKSLVSIGENAKKAYYLVDDQHEIVPYLFRQNKSDDLIQSLSDYLGSNDFTLKRAAIIGLGWLRAIEAKEKLLGCLRDIRLIHETSEAFMGMGDEVIPYLVDNIEDEDERIRIAIATIIGSCKAQIAEKSLIRRLSDDIGHVRSATAHALKKMGSEKAVSGLIKLLGDEYPDVCDAAIAALIEINGPKVLAGILYEFDDPGTAIEESIVKVFCAITGPEKIDTLLFLLKDANSVIRKTVVEKLGTISGDAVLEPLLLALTDEYPDVRVVAAQALAHVKNDKVYQALTRAVNDKNIWVTSAAIHALGFFINETVVDFLIQKLEDKRSIVQIAVVQSLARFKSNRVVETIKTLFLDKELDMEVRRSSASVLGEFHDPVVLPLMLEALAEKDWNFKYSIINALAHYEHPDIFGPVMALAKDTRETSLLRQGAIRVFLKNHSEQSILELIDLLQDHDEKVVETAFTVLQSLKKYYWQVIEKQKQKPEQQYNWLLDFFKPGE